MCYRKIDTPYIKMQKQLPTITTTAIQYFWLVIFLNNYIISCFSFSNRKNTTIAVKTTTTTTTTVDSGVPRVVIGKTSLLPLPKGFRYFLIYAFITLWALNI